MKISLPIPLTIFILLFPLILAMGGWFSRDYILAASYFMRFQNAKTNDLKCGNLLQILRVSPEASLTSVVQQTYSNRQYKVKRGTLLWNKYAVAELKETTESVTSQKEWKGSNLEVVLFKKESHGNLQVIYSCEKLLG